MSLFIPENKRQAVNHALAETFATTDIEDILQLTAGLSSALIYRIQVIGKYYLLRVITRTDTMANPAIWYAAMQQAADAGIAPRVLYADLDERILITDFIENRPFFIKDARKKLPMLLKALHALQPFTKRMNYWDTITTVIHKFKEDKLAPPEEIEGIFEGFDEIKAAYTVAEEDMVSSHNDLKPENILFDGEKIWLIDWEAAFLNDRYLDLAVLANFLITDSKDENDFLNLYFDAQLDELKRAKFFLACQMLHVAYFVFFIMAGKAKDEAVNYARPTENFIDFHKAIWDGMVSLADKDNRIHYALVHRDAFRKNYHSDRFSEALTIVIQHKPSSQ